MNVIDKYKGMLLDDIKADVSTRRAGFTSVFLNLTHDFNKSVGVRNHNAFGGKDIWFVGRRQWDKRGAVGTYHYEDIHYAANWDEYMQSCPTGLKIAVENTGGPKQRWLHSFTLPYHVTFIYGEEGAGIPDEILQSSHYILGIPMYGSVRSLNVSVSSGIIMNEYRRQHALLNSRFM